MIVTLSKPVASGKPAFFFKTTDGTSIGEKLTGTASGAEVVFTGTGVAAGDLIIADYYYESTASAKSMTISSDVFPGTYLLEGTTMWRTEQGYDVEALYTIPKLKILPGFTIGMASSGDPQPLHSMQRF